MAPGLLETYCVHWLKGVKDSSPWVGDGDLRGL